LRHCVDNVSCPRIIRARNATARTPDQVVDTIVAWFEGGAADGFNIMAAALPSGRETFIDHVLPVLRRKGLFREDYADTTLHAHYGLPAPTNQFHKNGA
jgi:hypothetical protein